MNITISPYQQAFLDWLEDGWGSCVLVAVAGAGKTTILMEGLKVIPQRCSVQVLMFNVQNAKDAKVKLDQMIRDTGLAFRSSRIGTFHSLGWGAMRRYYERKGITPRDPSANKLRDLIREDFSADDQERYGDFCAKLVGYARQSGIGPLVPDSDDNWWELIQHHDLYLEDGEATEEMAVTLARRLLLLSNQRADQGICDFDDMLYQPLRWRLRLWQNDYVFIDEAQDTNAVRRALAKLALKPGGRLGAVGDPKQAIYGFTGASHDAIELIKREFHAKELMLPVCYRCSASVVAKAREIVDYIQPAPGAQEGSVTTLHPDDAMSMLGDHDAILCRNTAPLVSHAFKLIAQGRGCTVLGREIGQGLIKLIRKQKTARLDVLLKRLDKWASREIAKFTARGEEQKASGIHDRVACINAVVEALGEKDRTLPGLIGHIEGLFSDGNGKLMLSTVHKAKGREWDNVAILRPDLMPSGWARQDWQYEQERNLMYVAWTRARTNLIFMDEGAARLKNKKTPKNVNLALTRIAEDQGTLNIPF